MNEKKRQKRTQQDAAYQDFQGQRAAYEAELDAQTGTNQGPGAAKRHTSNSRYDWRKSSKKKRPNAAKETNRGTPCPDCGAGVGETCFQMGEKRLRVLSKTHRTQRREQEAMQEAEARIREASALRRALNPPVPKGPKPAPMTPKPNKPGLLFGGRAKTLDEMRQQRRTDNGA